MTVLVNITGFRCTFKYITHVDVASVKISVYFLFVISLLAILAAITVGYEASPTTWLYQLKNTVKVELAFKYHHQLDISQVWKKSPHCGNCLSPPVSSKFQCNCKVQVYHVHFPRVLDVWVPNMMIMNVINDFLPLGECIFSHNFPCLSMLFSGIILKLYINLFQFHELNQVSIPLLIGRCIPWCSVFNISNSFVWSVCLQTD